jgi:hypothetical protein
LADLAFNKGPVKDKFSNMIKGTSSSIVMGIVLSEVPFIGIAIASVLGLLGFNSTVRNRMITKKEMMRRTVKGIVKTGGTFAVGIYGGVLG